MFSTANGQLHSAPPAAAVNTEKLWCLVPMCQVASPGAGRIECADRVVTPEEKRRMYLKIVVKNDDPSKIYFPPPSLEEYAKLPNDVIIIPGCIQAPPPMRAGLAQCVAEVRPLDGRVHLVADPLTDSIKKTSGYDLQFQTSGADGMPEVRFPDVGLVRMLPSWSGGKDTNGVAVPLTVAFVP